MSRTGVAPAILVVVGHGRDSPRVGSQATGEAPARRTCCDAADCCARRRLIVLSVTVAVTGAIAVAVAVVIVVALMRRRLTTTPSTRMPKAGKLSAARITTLRRFFSGWTAISTPSTSRPMIAVSLTSAGGLSMRIWS